MTPVIVSFQRIIMWDFDPHREILLRITTALEKTSKNLSWDRQVGRLFKFV